MQENNIFNDGFPDEPEENVQEETVSLDEIARQAKESIRKKEYYMDGRKKRGKFLKWTDDLFFRLRKWWKCLKKRQKALIISLTSLILVLLLVIVWFFINFGYRYNGISSKPEDLGFEDVIDENVINIALFGIDSRNTKGKACFKGNSDSIMVLSANTKTKKVKVISIMRDTLVPIEQDDGVVYGKINSAYSKGGPELAIKTLNKNFALDISEYATVNFYGMSDIIDAVGGIEATITPDEVLSTGKNNHGINDMINEICQYQNLEPKDYYVTLSGQQHLNGIQAVAYARIRYCTSIWGTKNDYGRTDRQRYVLEQLFSKAKNLQKKEYINLAKALIPCTETSLSYSDIINLANKILFGNPIFEEYRIPQNSDKINFLMNPPKGSFGSVVYYDLQYAAKVINAVIYDDMTVEEYVNEYEIEKNDWYAEVLRDLAKKVSNGNSGKKSTPSKKNVVSENKTGNTNSQDNTSSQDSYSSNVSSAESTASDTVSRETQSDYTSSASSEDSGNNSTPSESDLTESQNEPLNSETSGGDNTESTDSSDISSVSSKETTSAEPEISENTSSDTASQTESHTQ